MTTKVCNRCFIEQDINCFYKNNNTVDGYYYQCKACTRIKHKNYLLLHKDQIAAYQKEYRKQWNKDNRQYRTLHKKNRRQTDLNYRLLDNLRSRLTMAVRNNSKAGSAVQDLGCSIEEFKAYLESKFQEGMTWDNWGKYGWHIDHIVPLASFDLTNPAQIKKACHYTNLQPLWAEDNLKKGNTMPPSNN